MTPAAFDTLVLIVTVVVYGTATGIIFTVVHLVLDERDETRWWLPASDDEAPGEQPRARCAGSPRLPRA